MNKRPRTPPISAHMRAYRIYRSCMARYKSSPFTVAELEAAVLARTRLPDTCRYCAEPLSLKTISLDHMIPITRGGGNAPANVQFICRRCNTRKGALTHEEYNQLLSFLTYHAEMKQILLRRLGMAGYIYRR